MKMMNPLRLLTLVLVSRVDAQMTQKWRDEVVEEHNRIRRTELAPDMLIMEYDMKLECVAQGYVDAKGGTGIGPFGFPGHNPNLSGDYAACGGEGQVGENWASNGPSPTDHSFKGATDLWCDGEIGGCSERDAYNGKCQAQVGHFTQVMWTSSYKVGCGYTEKGGTFCNYSPAGNYQGQDPWKAGTPCSACPESHPYCDEGLCSAFESSAATQAAAATAAAKATGSLVIGEAQAEKSVHSTTAAVTLPLSLVILVIAIVFLRRPIQEASEATCLGKSDVTTIGYVTTFLFFVLFGLSITACVLPDWTVVTSGAIVGDVSPFNVCPMDLECVDTLAFTQPSMMNGLITAVRFFSITLVVSSLGATVAAAFVSKSAASGGSAGAVSLVLAGLGCYIPIAAFFSIGLWGAYSDDRLSSDAPVRTSALGVGFILEMVCFFVALLAWVFSSSLSLRVGAGSLMSLKQTAV